MRRYIRYLCFSIIILSLGVVRVNALECYKGILTENDENFLCIGASSNLTFTYNGQDYSSYFKMWNDGKTVEIVPTISFPNDVEIATIEVKDGDKKTTIRFKNKNYVKEEVVTTTSDNKLYLTLYNERDNKPSKKDCIPDKESKECSIYLPKLDIEGFNGWDKNKGCTKGVSETSITIKNNQTYYACFIKEVVDLSLSSLIVKDDLTKEDIDYGTFNSETTSYDIKVLFEVEKLLIEAKAVDIKAQITYENNENLQVGNNVISIIVSDKDGNKKDYTLNVERLAEGVTLDKAHYLSSLVIGGYEDKLNFDSKKLEYTITIKSNINRLLITNETMFEDDEVFIRGNENLETNSKIIIDVFNEKDNYKTTYTINIIKEKSPISIIIIIGGVLLGIALIVGVVLLIINKTKKSKTPTAKIKKAKEKAKVNKPEILSNKSEDIEVLKF